MILVPWLPKDVMMGRKVILTEGIMVGGRSASCTLCLELRSDLLKQIRQARILHRMVRHHAAVIIIVHSAALRQLVKRGCRRMRERLVCCLWCAVGHVSSTWSWPEHAPMS